MPEATDRADAAAARGAAALFDLLHEHGIRCCLWRGSSRVDRALAGTSDFDLLVAEDQAAALAAALQTADCRRARTVDGEPGLEDWFALVRPTGPLLHLHVHYRLVAGEPRHNRYRLPWEDEVLASRQPPRVGRPPVADPVVECALLLLRCSLQLRWRDRFGTAFGRSTVAKVHSDLRVLLPASDRSAATTLLARWLGQPPQLRLDDDRAPSLMDLWRLRAAAAAALRPWASATGLAAAGRLWRRDLLALARRLCRRLRLPMLPRRGPLRGGLLIVLTGGETAARRALAAAMWHTFAGKFDVLLLPAARLERARRARNRGMLAVVDAGPDGPAIADADLIARGDGDAAALLLQVWRRL